MSDAPRILPLVLCAIRRRDHIALLRRNHPPYRGCWGMPGGKLHAGEMLLDGARREALEETGLQCETAVLRGVATEFIREQESAAVEAHFLMFVIELSAPSDELVSGREGVVAWHPVDHLPADMIDSDQQMLERFVLTAATPEVPHFNVERAGETYRLA